MDEKNVRIIKNLYWQQKAKIRVGNLNSEFDVEDKEHSGRPNCIDDWIASKDEAFFGRGIHMLPEKWKKVVASGSGHYFE
ncbi:hypothetical protein ALC53_04530 [Atta colombica]|uniref:Uncharacterized protein n=1 Tax=Atta colombica TaxID=520822 RepID=A0A151I4D4_9HYME|nr:hypothetical protein ALC53_04530 [Atta colombica]